MALEKSEQPPKSNLQNQSEFVTSNRTAQNYEDFPESQIVVGLSLSLQVGSLMSIFFFTFIRFYFSFSSDRLLLVEVGLTRE